MIQSLSMNLTMIAMASLIMYHKKSARLSAHAFLFLLFSVLLGEQRESSPTLYIVQIVEDHFLLRDLKTSTACFSEHQDGEKWFSL